METKKNKLVISEKEGVICYGYFQDGIPAELYCEPKEQESLLGNIYAARVYCGRIQGAFLEIGEGQKCYYSLSGEQPIKLSPGHENKLYGGDVILVQITKDAVNTKLPVCTETLVWMVNILFLLSQKNVSVFQKNSKERGKREIKFPCKKIYR